MTNGNKFVIGTCLAIGVLQFVHIIGSENPTGSMARQKLIVGIVMISIAIAGYNWAKRNPPQR
ncbi:hypothetical protein [Fibrella aquatica]|uniref:hypothetical protein n=1 Tax=Fibrella aquatica TaxID=3242487 RepID=UPI0035221C30